MSASITLSPSELMDVKRMAASDIKDAVLEGIAIDELQLMDISTVAAFTGLPVERVAKSMPIIELGPRSRRVRISDYKAYLAANTRQPTNQTARAGVPSKSSARSLNIAVTTDSAGRFVASVPQYHGCHTQGATLAEALDRIQEAIALHE